MQHLFTVNLTLVYLVTFNSFHRIVKSQIVLIWLWIYHEWCLKEVTHIDIWKFGKKFYQPAYMTVLWFCFKSIPLFSQLKRFSNSASRNR